MSVNVYLLILSSWRRVAQGEILPGRSCKSSETRRNSRISTDVHGFIGASLGRGIGRTTFKFIDERNHQASGS